MFADTPNGHTAAKAVLAHEYKGNPAPVVFIWNGAQQNELGASLSVSVREGPYPSSIDFSPSGPVDGTRIGDYKQAAELVSMLARTNSAECCYVYNQAGYARRKTFKDRPGVGWMLYLPRVLTQRDVPEARDLIPVMEGRKQLGTIIVSITDGVFDYRNPAHLKIAQSIEVRLVDNDWLPTWAQMMRPT